jgi:hypothetical protein
MTQVILPFLTSIALATIAAFFSIIGLAQIFPGSFWPIVIMGTVIEIGKLVTVSWLYNNWKETSILLKSYFLSAIVIIMLITSMGIFGYLSKAHIESNIVVGSNSVQLQILERQEQIANERLQYLLKKAGDDPEKISRTTDRAIQQTQSELKQLSEQKLPLLKEENALLAEIGPIKYIAELIYDKSDPSFIDKAVRIVILLIIFVFDPLAVLLLVAANQSYRNLKNTELKNVLKKETLDKTYEDDIQYNVDEIYQIIPKDKVAQFKKDGDVL